VGIVPLPLPDPNGRVSALPEPIPGPSAYMNWEPAADPDPLNLPVGHY
jgi:hypothetical protein